MSADATHVTTAKGIMGISRSNRRNEVVDDRTDLGEDDLVARDTVILDEAAKEPGIPRNLLLVDRGRIHQIAKIPFRIHVLREGFDDLAKLRQNVFLKGIMAFESVIEAREAEDATTDPIPGPGRVLKKDEGGAIHLRAKSATIQFDATEKVATSNMFHRGTPKTRGARPARKTHGARRW